MPMLKTPWRLARSLQTLKDEVKAEYPGTTIWTVGDADHQRRNSDHNSNYQGVVCAIDVVGEEQAGALWDFLLKAKDPREKYQIHKGKIVNSTYHSWRVRDFGGHPHNSHIHVSVGRGSDNYSTRSDLYDNPSPWGFSKGAGDMAALQVVQIQDALNAAGITDKNGNKLSEDDAWGPLTRSALVKALRGGGVPPDLRDAFNKHRHGEGRTGPPNVKA